MNRDQYVLEMRKAFSNPNSIHPNGELNHKYFQTKLGQFWTEKEYTMLMKGLQEYGVDAWSEINNKYLKNWVKRI